MWPKPTMNGALKYTRPSLGKGADYMLNTYSVTPTDTKGKKFKRRKNMGRKSCHL